MNQLPTASSATACATTNWHRRTFQARPIACLSTAMSLAVMVFIAPVGQAIAADIFAGQKAASQCTVCHGRNGLATNPEAPNLAGESAIYIEKQLVAFKSGQRQHRQMSLVAQGLELETIRNLAAWYEAMKVTVELPSRP